MLVSITGSSTSARPAPADKNAAFLKKSLLVFIAALSDCSPGLYHIASGLADTINAMHEPIQGRCRRKD